MKLKKQEFKKRRQELMAMMGSNSIAFLPTAPVANRNRDVDHIYRQDSDFCYITGFSEPEALVVLIPGREQAEYILFCREKDDNKELWHGRRTGLEGACEEFGADDSFPITDIDEIIPGLMENRDQVYYPMGCNAEFDIKLLEWLNQLRGNVRKGGRPPTEFISLDHVLHEMRLIKKSWEIKLMQMAADISVEAHIRAMKAVRPKMKEFQLEAEYLHEFITQGARSTAYPSIVGGGKNACVLHYIDNNESLKSGDLVLVDAGAEYQNYAADITRTFPVNGRFTTNQKLLYQIVLDAQNAAIEAIKPGIHWDDPHNIAVDIITEGLINLKILKGSKKKLIKDGAYKAFFMHKTGHWLGLDVHDVGDYKVEDEWRQLEMGMVLTVEPGLYFSHHSKVANKWKNIGIRIEDDVLVTADGHHVLTQALPKTIEEIEYLMNS